jgi:hypothetical protein
MRLPLPSAAGEAFLSFVCCGIRRTKSPDQIAGRGSAFELRGYFFSSNHRTDGILPIAKVDALMQVNRGPISR